MSGERGSAARAELLTAYFCELPGRWYGRSYEAPDPGEWTVPCGIFLARTRGQAKRMLIDDDRAASDDEFVEVRSRLLSGGVQGTPGRTEDPLLWGRVHEVQDHGGHACDCPESTWDEEVGDWVDVRADGALSSALSSNDSVPGSRGGGGGGSAG